MTESIQILLIRLLLFPTLKFKLKYYQRFDLQSQSNIIVKLKEKTQKYKAQVMMSNEFITQINTKDEIKILKKKLQMLKDAVKKQRNEKGDLQSRLAKYKDKCRDYQNQLKKKDEKNEHLIAQIRMLKDTLLIERNQKIKYVDMVAQMKKKQESSQPTPNGTSRIGGYLGSFWK